MKLENLSPDQLRAVESVEGRVLILGGAGSGKTTVALWCARHMLERQDAKRWHRALFLTFSRTAVREIINRSHGAVAPIQDRLEVQTFHSFAHRMIQAFGPYAGLGTSLPPLQSEAQQKLFGRDRAQLAYEDLVPAALTVVQSKPVKRLLSDRWPIVICDEFQDTDDEQWELLCELSGSARLILLADPNQMIYGFLRARGVKPERVEQARENAELVVDLGEPSYRDPSGVIPSMASAVRRRQFEADAVRAAVESGRLSVRASIGEEDLIDAIRARVIESKEGGAASIGIFGHSNLGVAELSAGLLDQGVDHALVGLPEAHGEALAVMEASCLHGLGRLDLDSLREQMAVFLASAVRGKNPPDLARMLVGQLPMPEGLEVRLRQASDGLVQAAEQALEELVGIAIELWPKIFQPGRRPWDQASRTFGATAQQLIGAARGSEEAFTSGLEVRLAQMRSESLLEPGYGAGHSIQIMNFHQTKGREADDVILVYRDGDWFGDETEPFPENSKVLYVALTRARRRVEVLLPEDPHPLVAPFARFLA